jgi:hypothetical protein
MEYNGTVNIFMKVLLTKKYALPYRVIDRLVEYFNSFMEERRNLPVIWHQAVLVFAQRYKEDLTKEQKDALKAVIKVHTHPMIAPEIRRELDNSASRGEVLNGRSIALSWVHSFSLSHRRGEPEHDARIDRTIAPFGSYECHSLMSFSPVGSTVWWASSPTTG